MDNNCNYSDNWQPYIGDYDKFEYDIKLHDGTIVENCYPNGGLFNSISDEHNEQAFPEDLVVEIRFSNAPRFGINQKVSQIPQYEWLNKQEEIRNKRVKNINAIATISGIIGGLGAPIMYQPSPSTSNDINKFGKARTVEYIAGSQRHEITDKEIEQSAIGRNEPCPCGSGKKFKKCCSIL